MTKRELRKLAESKGIGFMMSRRLLFFIFPGDTKAHAATKDTIEQVRLLPDHVEPQESGRIDIAPIDAVSLEGLSQEEREAKVLELMGKSVPNDIPGLDNYPIEAQSYLGS
jgi:hypothetical protein